MLRDEEEKTYWEKILSSGNKKWDNKKKNHKK